MFRSCLPRAGERIRNVDTVGLGFTGAIMAGELAKAGLDVVGLQRDRTPGEDLNSARRARRDEVFVALRADVGQLDRHDHLPQQDVRTGTSDPARGELPGEDVGGSSIHWGGQYWRCLPADFRNHSVIQERCAAKAIPEDMHPGLVGQL
jgi:gluconate 2-dehydrogenase alpha chain